MRELASLYLYRVSHPLLGVDDISGDVMGLLSVHGLPGEQQSEVVDEEIQREETLGGARLEGHKSSMNALALSVDEVHFYFGDCIQVAIFSFP